MISFTSQRKTPSTAVLLAVLLEVSGPKFYLKQTGMGIMYLLFCWTGIPALVALIEAFTVTAQVNRINTEIARRRWACWAVSRSILSSHSSQALRPADRGGSGGRLLSGAAPGATRR